MTDPVFYTLCILQGINGLFVLPFVFATSSASLLQGTYENPRITPYRRACLFALSASLLLSCAFGWSQPALTAVFAWAAVGFGAASSIGAALLQHGARGVLLLQRLAYLSLAARVAVAFALTVLARSILRAAG